MADNFNERMTELLVQKQQTELKINEFDAIIKQLNESKIELKSTLRKIINKIAKEILGRDLKEEQAENDSDFE